jgi:hypothetical protein
MRSREGITTLDAGGLMPKNGSASVGVYGSKVRVAERSPGGALYLLWVDKQGRQQKRSLGHADRRRGKDEALAFANQLADDREGAEAAKVTVAMLFDIYELHGLHGRTETHRREVRRKLSMWRTFLGEDGAVESLSPADVERFVASRRDRTIGPSRRLRERTVGMTTLWHDFVALATALNFATRHRDARGRPMPAVNPPSLACACRRPSAQPAPLPIGACTGHYARLRGR